MTAAPGVGKSRLKEELVRRARARGSVCVWQADCDPVTTGAPFSVASALVRSALELPPGLPPEALRAHARGKLDALQASPSERASAEAFLLELAGASQDDERVRVAREGRGVLGEQLERAFGDLLAWQLSSGPLLVIVDDLQWGDLTSVRLIDLSLASQAESPLVVLVLARPELEQVFPRLFSARAPLHYALAELTRAASEALARDVLGERATPELVRTLVERAAGNAFFLEELLRAAATGGDEAPPETVLAMLDARVSALDPEARRVLRAASLFGVVFPEDGVVAALGGAARAESTRAWLGELEAREILARAPERAGPSALAFRHALVREAVYGTLLDDDRRLGHRLAAEWLEASSDAPDARVLARHWQLAGERARAAAAFVRAAGHALDANDPTAVIELASAARACGAEGPLLARAWVLEGTAYGFRGELDTAVSAAREAMALAPEGSPDWLDAVRAYLLGERHFDGTGARLDLEALAREVEPFLATDPTRAALVLADVAHRLVTRIELEAADQLLTRLRALADGAAATPSSLGAVAVARISQVSSARRLAAGDLAGHLVERERARALFSEVGALRDALEAQSAVAYGHTLVGHYEEAEQAIRRAEREARRLGLEHLRHVNVHNLGLVVLRLGRPDECIALEAEARAWLEQAHDSRLAGTCMHYAALAHVEKGELDQAEALYRAYLDTHAHYPGNRAEALAGLAWVLARRGDGEGARGPAAEAVRIVDELGGIDEAEPFIRLAHVEALFAAGAASEAREALALAHDKLEAALLAITDPAMRATCAARVPEHARLRELAREHLGDVPRRAAVLYHEV
jgi:tetratricopeptide (TPR) repeat protein